MADDTVTMLADLRHQVTRISIDEPCSPAEIKLANALAVLISITEEQEKRLNELHTRTIGQMRFGGARL